MVAALVVHGFKCLLLGPNVKHSAALTVTKFWIYLSHNAMESYNNMSTIRNS